VLLLRNSALKERREPPDSGGLVRRAYIETGRSRYPPSQISKGFRETLEHERFAVMLRDWRMPGFSTATYFGLGPACRPAAAYSFFGQGRIASQATHHTWIAKWILGSMGGATSAAEITEARRHVLAEKFSTRPRHYCGTPR